MATYSSVLAWRIPRTEESGGVQSIGLQRRTQLNNWPHIFIIALLNLYLQSVSFLVPPFGLYTNGTLCVLRPFVEKAMAPHSSTLAWKIPWTEEPGRLQSVGSRRVGHD